MKLPSKVRYAVSAMFDIAMQSNGKAVATKDISLRQKISLDYLEQIFNKLRKAGLVKSMRGPGGGFKLSRKPNKISIGDIIRAIEGPIGLATCVYGSCDKKSCCSTKVLWDELSKKISKTFDSTNLASLVRGRG